MSNDISYIEIITSYQSAYVFYNDKRPWWKSRRPVWFIGANMGKIFDLRDHKIDIDKLFIRFEGEENLMPLKEHCCYG